MATTPNSQTSIDEVAAVKALLQSMTGQFDAPPSIPEVRTNYDNWGLAYPLIEGTQIEKLTLGGVPSEKLTVPGARPDTALIYLHGGGYALGSIDSHRHMIAQLAVASGMMGYAVDYRLAPEHVFPAALDDALAAYEAILATGIAPDKIVIAGDSAGGGLTLACALAIKAKGLPQPAGLFAISPWVNLAQTGASYAAKAEVDFICNFESLNNWAAIYLAGESAGNPLASPHLGDLSGLAPLLIHVGSEEVLLSDSISMAQAAGLACVDVQLLIAPHMPHVFHYMWPQVTAARLAIVEAGNWMKTQTK